MATVTFFGKPGCSGNKRQMELLRTSGHTVIERDLLSEPWTAAALQAYFGDQPPAAWFNRSATRVKSGEIDPDRLGAAEATALLLSDHLLIRRPLLEVDGVRAAGWDPARISAWIGLADGVDHGGEGCVHPKAAAATASCPTP